MKHKPLTATMAGAIAEIHDHGGEIVRHDTGCWSYPGCALSNKDAMPVWFLGERTVQALIDRELLEVIERRNGRPIRARAVSLDKIEGGQAA